MEPLFDAFQAIGLAALWDDSKDEHRRRSLMRYSETHQHMRLPMLCQIGIQGLESSYEALEEDDYSSRGGYCGFR